MWWLIQGKLLILQLIEINRTNKNALRLRQHSPPMV